MAHLSCLAKIFFKNVFFLSLFLSVSCTSTVVADSQNTIVALLGCEDDAYNDLLFSIEGIKAFAETNQISIKIDESDIRCGYLLLGDEQKYIEGALTDYDLMMLVKDFFLQKK